MVSEPRTDLPRSDVCRRCGTRPRRERPLQRQGMSVPAEASTARGSEPRWYHGVFAVLDVCIKDGFFAVLWKGERVWANPLYSSGI